MVILIFSDQRVRRSGVEIRFRIQTTILLSCIFRITTRSQLQESKGDGRTDGKLNCSFPFPLPFLKQIQYHINQVLIWDRNRRQFLRCGIQRPPFPQKGASDGCGIRIKYTTSPLDMTYTQNEMLGIIWVKAVILSIYHGFVPLKTKLVFLTLYIVLITQVYQMPLVPGLMHT